MPVAEALACGCFVVGYTGLGGTELFDLCSPLTTARPVEFGNWPSFVSSVISLVDSFSQSPQPLMDFALRSSNEIRNRYTTQRLGSSLVSALSKIEQSL